jgi:hypothetical protein
MQLCGASPFGNSENPKRNTEFVQSVVNVILVHILCSQLSKISVRYGAQYPYTGSIRAFKSPFP